jgi:hypothetical protein
MSLDDALSPHCIGTGSAGGIAVKLIFLKYRYSITKLIFTSVSSEVNTPKEEKFMSFLEIIFHFFLEACKGALKGQKQKNRATPYFSYR